LLSNDKVLTYYNMAAALRMSLGAPAPRIVRQLLTESLLLSVTGGVAGVGLAWAATEGFASRTVGLLPRGAEIGLDGTVLGVAVLLALVVTGLAGVLPALRAAGLVREPRRPDGQHPHGVGAAWSAGR
jgi:ABC-type antimicrobial peptide transport system permease subunit